MAITSPRASSRAYPTAPLTWHDLWEWCRKLAEIVNNIMDGKINATGSVTLTQSSATSTLTDRRLGPDSVILFMPTTANAATELATLYVTAQGKQTATLNHANNSQTDRTFRYAVIG